jgi:hypothetical protein
MKTEIHSGTGVARLRAGYLVATFTLASLEATTAQSVVRYQALKSFGSTTNNGREP